MCIYNYWKKKKFILYSCNKIVKKNKQKKRKSCIVKKAPTIFSPSPFCHNPSIDTIYFYFYLYSYIYFYSRLICLLHVKGEKKKENQFYEWTLIIPSTVNLFFFPWPSATFCVSYNNLLKVFLSVLRMSRSRFVSLFAGFFSSPVYIYISIWPLGITDFWIDTSNGQCPPDNPISDLHLNLQSTFFILPNFLPRNSNKMFFRKILFPIKRAI